MIYVHSNSTKSYGTDWHANNFWRLLNLFQQISFHKYKKNSSLFFLTLNINMESLNKKFLYFFNIKCFNIVSTLCKLPDIVSQQMVKKTKTQKNNKTKINLVNLDLKFQIDPKMTWQSWKQCTSLLRPDQTHCPCVTRKSRRLTIQMSLLVPVA